MIKKIKYYSNLILIFFLLFIVSCNRNQEKKINQVVVKHPFFGIKPTDKPQLLVPNLIATPAEEYNGTFSPDGKEFYYTIDIPENAFIAFTQLKDDNTWSEPKVAAFSGKYPDYDPLFSPDGSKLFFSSRRPVSDTTTSKIWYVEKINKEWSEPQPISLTGSENNEFYSSVTKDEVIYFNIWSTGNIFKAKKNDTTYLVEKLPEIINSDYKEGDPFISPNEDYLIFRGYREDSYGRGDLYISFNIENEWTEPENLGEPINSPAHEICPSVTSDGNIFIFASSRLTEKVEVKPLESVKKVREKYQTYDNGELNIYYMSAGFIDDLRKKYKESSNK
ncbi:MAG: hypothetical protein GY756_15940 [bacterium]|nr:hypothetical protein [bacterium]